MTVFRETPTTIDIVAHGRRRLGAGAIPGEAPAHFEAARNYPQNLGEGKHLLTRKSCSSSAWRTSASAFREALALDVNHAGARLDLEAMPALPLNE